MFWIVKSKKYALFVDLDFENYKKMLLENFTATLQKWNL